MLIHLFGGGFTNKGAELMLRTVIARLRDRLPSARLAITPDRQTSYEQRASLQLAHIFPNYQFFHPMLRRLMVRSSLATTLAEAPYRMLIPRRAESMYGLVNQNNVDALIDISGYAFGDAFSWIRCRVAAKQAQRFAKRGKPVILMPQMFGPFEHPKTRHYFKQLCEAATLIYAREQASYDTVRDILGDDPRLKQAPDITIFSPTSEDIETGFEGESYGVLVPNERMLDQGRDEWGDSYVSRLVEAGKQMVAHGLRPAIVIHSGDAGDQQLATQLGSELSAATDQSQPFVFSHSNPLVLKKFIGGAKFLVGSRFHSLVAALSSAVPGVALGWAHKYEMLAADFGVPELIHRGSDSIDHLLSQVDRLADDSENQQLRGIIADRRTAMQNKADAMWEEVFAALGSSKTSA